MKVCMTDTDCIIEIMAGKRVNHCRGLVVQ